MRLLIATRNPGKRREFAVLLGDLLPDETEVVDIASWPTELPEVVEDRDTFEGNARKKAEELSELTGCTTLADDSGLEVDALDGRPGVYSARYAGEHATELDNNALLVEELQGVPTEQRSARYVAALALVLADDELGRALRDRLGSDERVVNVRATCEGRIVDEPRGDGGFGYDPHFFIEEWEKTMAEVPLDRKNEISHRARATRRLARLFSPTE